MMNLLTLAIHNAAFLRQNFVCLSEDLSAKRQKILLNLPSIQQIYRIHLEATLTSCTILICINAYRNTILILLPLNVQSYVHPCNYYVAINLEIYNKSSQFFRLEFNSSNDCLLLCKPLYTNLISY